MKSCGTQGDSVRTYVCTSPQPHPQGFVSFGAYSDPDSVKWPKSKQHGPNLSKMAQIQVLWSDSKQMAQIWLEIKYQQVAQGQYVVSDTRCPALHGCKLK